MGRYTVRFKCHHCGHCCRDVVCLPTPWDVVRIVKETGANPRKFLEFLTPDEVSEVDKRDPTWLRCRKGRYIMALKRKKKGCYFLDKNTRFCGIYESRPILCRLYPLKLHETAAGDFKGFSIHPADEIGCPRHQDGVLDTDPMYELYLNDQRHQEDYDELVRFFNKGRHKHPEDFMELFIKTR